MQYTASYLFTDLPDILRPSVRFRECASSFRLFHLVGRGAFTWLCMCGFCLFVCFAGNGNNIEAFNSFLLRFFNQTSFQLHPSYSEVPRASNFWVFPSSEVRFDVFLVPRLLLYKAKVQFFISVKSITNEASIFRIPKFGWHLNSALTPFQHSLPDWIYLFLYYYYYYFNFFIIIIVWFGQGAERNECHAFDLPSLTISSKFLVFSFVSSIFYDLRIIKIFTYSFS